MIRDLLNLIPGIRHQLIAGPEHRRLKSISSQLAFEQVEKTQVLPDRRAMLDALDRPGMIAGEVGVARGDFADLILSICQPAKLHLIDYWKTERKPEGFSFGKAKRKIPAYEVVRQRFREEIDTGSIVLHRGYSWDELTKFSDRYFDFLYIDAGHDYDSVTRDLEIARPKLKPDGLLAGHDYTKWGRLGSRMGVFEAVNEFCIRHRFRLKYITLDAQTHPSFALSQY